MLLPDWVWVFTTTFASIISITALAICLSYRRRIESIIEDASSVADLTSQKIRLDAEIERCVQSLDKDREELRKLESERQQQESLRQELAQEKQKVDEYRKEAEVLQNAVSGLKQDCDRLNSEKTGLATDRDMKEGQLESEADAKSVVKLRVVKRHTLRA